MTAIVLICILEMFLINLTHASTNKANIQQLSLKQVQDYAVKHSTATTNAQLDVKKARKKIWETTAIGLPQISAKATYRDLVKQPVTLIPATFTDPNAEPGTYVGMTLGVQHNASLELTLNQLVFSGSYIVALQASKTYLQISKDALVKTEIEVKANVTDTYYLILLAEDSRKRLAHSLENLNITLDETKELFKSGFMEDTDVDQVQIAVTDLENSVKSMDRQIAITYRLLKFQMGFDLDKPIGLEDDLTTILAALETEALLKAPLRLETHIDFRILGTEEKSNRLLLKREKTEYLPTVSAYVTHLRSAQRDNFDIFSKDASWLGSTTVGLSVEIPIFSSFMRGAKTAQARLDLQKTRNSKKELAEKLNLELMQERSAFTDARDKASSTNKNVLLSKKIYDKTKTKYHEGMSSSLDLVQIHNQYLTAESNYTKAVVDLLKAKTRLDKVLSRL
ncbi:MAG: TolC family protein [bacterium]|nr:TolC family protein [bacterium]